MKRMATLFLLLTACGKEVSQEEVEAECSPEFLLQYDIEALDEQYAPTVEAAVAYGIDEVELDLEAEADICLDYKAQYEVDQQGYEGLAVQVEASANADAFALGAARVDRGLRWVTFEGESDGSDVPIPPGWVTFVFIEGSDDNGWEHADFNEGLVRADHLHLDYGTRYRVSLAYPY